MMDFSMQLIFNGLLSRYDLALKISARYGFWGLVILICWQQIGYKESQERGPQEDGEIALDGFFHGWRKPPSQVDGLLDRRDKSRVKRHGHRHGKLLVREQKRQA